MVRPARRPVGRWGSPAAANSGQVVLGRYYHELVANLFGAMGLDDVVVAPLGVRQEQEPVELGTEEGENPATTKRRIRIGLFTHFEPVAKLVRKVGFEGAFVGEAVHISGFRNQFCGSQFRAPRQRRQGRPLGHLPVERCALSARRCVRRSGRYAERLRRHRCGIGAVGWRLRPDHDGCYPVRQLETSGGRIAGVHCSS